MRYYNYHLKIEYDGSKFVGWQIQKKGRSIQGEIQKILKRFLKKKIKLIGSGRTDTGVHALGQSANFLINYRLDHKKLLGTLNFFLRNKNISIISIVPRKISFHSRYDAIERTYLYQISNRESPLALDKNRSWHIKKKLNISEMKKGAKILTGKHDFSAFRSSSCSAKSAIRYLKKVNIKKQKNSKIVITCVSKSFLQQQVRSMVGCLKVLGEGKWDIKRLKKTLKYKQRFLCAPPAPPHGLYLVKVKY